MGLGRALAVALVGLEGHVVEVQADVTAGLPVFMLVGLPDAALGEARDRVRTALGNTGFSLPSRRITVNLSPAALPKAGTSFDLAVAAALLAALGEIPPGAAAQAVHLGELALDGRVGPVHGVLPAVLAAVRDGARRVVVPEANAAEARLVPNADVVAVRWLSDVVALHRGIDPAEWPGDWQEPPGRRAGPPAAPPDLGDVVGQVEARRALEVAAAGGHHLLLLGPPGVGKTMLAARLPGLLPDLDEEQALEVTAVHSVAGVLDPAAGLVHRPPYEDPHHSATVPALVGGGSGLPRPGAASRAHRGVLFLDEAPEFAPGALQALRQPLEQGELVIHRARGAARFPARFQLVLAANPCPCGRATGTGADCTCSPMARRRYLQRLSGPLLDRVDIQVEVAAVSRAELALAGAPETTATVAARVAAARAAQRARLRPAGWVTNAEVPGPYLRGPLALPAAVTRDADRALDAGLLSIRGYDRVLRVAWTEADLDGAGVPDRDHVGRALVLRSRERVAA
ncbi:MAG TPA: YifB family Mg chelatase-like AAA ATPase [Kineosporiaceae bacterium]|nr:YifB family Mg chelatase-like AAA ATPase [Kineosporiaceae bacterium]